MVYEVAPLAVLLVSNTLALQIATDCSLRIKKHILVSASCHRPSFSMRLWPVLID